MNKYKRYIKESWIIGHIDSYGAVHSIESDFNPYTSKNHFDLFGHCSKRWRWSFGKSITTVADSEFEPGDIEKIQNHLCRKYGIWFNDIGGWHDIDYLIKMSEKHL